MLPVDRRINHRVPFVTLGLIVVNTLAFVAVALAARDASHLVWIYKKYGAVPAVLQPYMLLTHMFMHGGPEHLAGNMLFLAFFGMNVERRLGALPYLILYLLSGLSSIGLFLLFSGRSDVPLVGASGAISGVTGMYLALFARRTVDVLWFFGILKAPAFLFILFWIGLEVAQALLLSKMVMVAHWAHVGGFLGGWVTLFTLLRLGFHGHPEVKPPPVKKLAESFTELRYIPLQEKAPGPATGTFALFLKHFDPPPPAAAALLPSGFSPAYAVRGLEFPAAEDLQNRLQEAGLATVIVSEKNRVRLPPLQIVNQIALNGALRLTDELGRELTRDPVFVYFLSAGRVQGRVLLDLFLTSPWSDFRISNALTSADLGSLAVQLRRRLGNAFLGPGFLALSEGRPDAIPSFESQADFDQHNLWGLQKLAVGMR